MPLRLNAHKTLNEANAKTHKRNDDKHQKQGVRRNSANKRADPFNSLGNEGGNITNNGSDSDGRFLQEHPFQNTKKELCYMDNITDYPHNHNEESKADKIRNRLRHKESGKLR